MKALTEVELDKLLAVAREHSEEDYLLLLVSVNHGLRVSEALGLTSANIVNGFLKIQRLKKSRATTQPLLPNEKDALELLAKTESGTFFKMSRATAWRRMQRYGAEAGIPEFKRHNHVLKHTTGRLAYLGGVGIPEIVSYLGHKNPANSLIYMQADEEEAAKKFGAIFG